MSSIALTRHCQIGAILYKRGGRGRAMRRRPIPERAGAPRDLHILTLISPTWRSRRSTNASTSDLRADRIFSTSHAGAAKARACLSTIASYIFPMISCEPTS